jgi:hypothetical protein
MPSTKSQSAHQHYIARATRALRLLAVLVSIVRLARLGLSLVRNE